MKLQLELLFPEFNSLQIRFGDRSLKPIYGAGCVRDPKLFLIFMNPTARNVSASSTWQGIRAPWIGTKNIWKLLFESGLLSKAFFEKTQALKPSEWTPKFAQELYTTLAKKKIYPAPNRFLAKKNSKLNISKSLLLNADAVVDWCGVYITNFAKCTMSDARPLKNVTFHAYRELLLKEIQLIRPKKIITFGNLVSSLLLGKSVKVSEYSGSRHEVFRVGNIHYSVYPTYYPVGQGMRNREKAIEKIKNVNTFNVHSTVEYSNSTL